MTLQLVTAATLWTVLTGFFSFVAGLDCYGCIYSADSEHAVLRDNIGCLIGRMNDSYLFPQSKWNSSRAGFVNAYGNADGIVHHMKYHYFNIPDEDNVTSCMKVTSYNPNYILRGWTRMAPAYYANNCVNYGDDQRVCFCSSDGCNGADGLSYNAKKFVVVAGLLFTSIFFLSFE